MDLKDIKFDKLFPIENESSNDEEDIFVVVRLHTKDLYTVIKRLSFFFIRFKFEKFSFVSPVVRYIALRILESNISRISAYNFIFVIDDIIYILQLQLPRYYY